MFGLFQEYGQTSKGGSKLRINGKWLYPSRGCNLDGVAPGMQVEYETTHGGKDGNLLILQRIRPAPAGANMGQAAASVLGGAPVGSTITDGDILRSVSNIVGNAAAAGKIQDPANILVWVDCAYIALTNMGKAQAPTGSGVSQGSAPKGPREPGQDDEPPPFDDSDVPW